MKNYYLMVTKFPLQKRKYWKFRVVVVAQYCEYAYALQ